MAAGGAAASGSSPFSGPAAVEARMAASSSASPTASEAASPSASAAALGVSPSNASSPLLGSDAQQPVGASARSPRSFSKAVVEAEKEKGAELLRFVIKKITEEASPSNFYDAGIVLLAQGRDAESVTFFENAALGGHDQALCELKLLEVYKVVDAAAALARVRGRASGGAGAGAGESSGGVE